MISTITPPPFIASSLLDLRAPPRPFAAKTACPSLGIRSPLRSDARKTSADPWSCGRAGQARDGSDRQVGASRAFRPALILRDSDPRLVRHRRAHDAKWSHPRGAAPAPLSPAGGTGAIA